MADMQKRMAAALAAVNAYLQMEEQAAAQLALQPPQIPESQPSVWSHSGRQDMMTLRRLIQLRTFTSQR